MRRYCGICGREMWAGFYNEGLVIEYHIYYCSEECRRHDMTDEEYNKLYDDNLMFYTEWYDEEEE